MEMGVLQTYVMGYMCDKFLKSEDLKNPYEQLKAWDLPWELLFSAVPLHESPTASQKKWSWCVLACPDLLGNSHVVTSQWEGPRHIRTWVQCMTTRVWIASCPGTEVVPLLVAKDVSLVYTGLH